MTKGRIIEIGAWIVTGFLLSWLIPRARAREAMIVFLFKQLMTWVSGLLVAEKNLIQYPERFFPKATRSSFTFEFFVYPAICVFFNIFYPFGTDLWRQALHYVVYTSGITGFEVILERYTQVIKYLNWRWYWTWITIFLTFLISNLYYRWFFQLR